MKTTLVLAAALSAGIAFAQQGGQVDIVEAGHVHVFVEHDIHIFQQFVPVRFG